MTRRTLIPAVAAMAALAATAGAIAASRDADPVAAGPLAPDGVDPAPAPIAGPKAPPPSAPALPPKSASELQADRQQVAREYAAFRASEAPTAVASNGIAAQLSIEPQGLCIKPSFGGMGCGNPTEAATHPPVLHIVGPDVEWIAGPVPDDVDRVVISTKDGEIAVDAHDNVFAVKLPDGSYQGLTWRMKDGRTARPLN